MEIRMIPTSQIVEDTGQPRTQASAETLEELAASIRQHGILNPITVVPLHNVGMYRIVTGERRWRAAQMAGLVEIPCVVRELDADEIRVQQLIENMQREDLQPLDRARGIVALQEQTGASAREVAAMLGLSERMVRNLLDLLDLPRDVGEQIVASPNRPADGRLTEKHARAIKQLADDPDLQRRVAERVQRDRLNTAETAAMVRAMRESPELSEEILTAPPEAFAGYLKAKERAAAERSRAAEAEHRRDETVGVVQACSTALNDIRPVGLDRQELLALREALGELRRVLEALERECALELAPSGE